MKSSIALALLLVPAAAAAQESTLSKAYLKELAFLKAQKAALEKRRAEVDASAQKRISAAKKEIDSFEGKLLRLRQDGDQLEEKLRDAERNQEQSDKADLAFETLARAREPLTAASLKVPALPADRVPTAEETTSAIQATFEKTNAFLKSSALVRKEPGKFFLTDGTLVSGELIHVGRIAVFGVATQGSGALAPAGGGKFRLWPAPSSQTAVGLAKGTALPSLRIFLFEQTEKAMVAKAEKTVLQEIKAGGLIAVVIVGLGLLALLMILYRAVAILSLDAKTGRLIDKVLPLVQSGHLQKAQRLVDQSTGAAARVLQATIRNLGADRARIDDVIEEAMLDETPAIERFGTAITVFAAVAPLLGLLGTVTGMIATFDVITEFGTGDPRMLSGGISEALITTKLGLVVAIPSLLLGTLLSGRADALIMRIEHAALKLVNASEGLDAGPHVPSDPPQVAVVPAVPEPAP